MRRLVLVGAGGLAREAAEAVRALNAVRPAFELVGCVDDDPARHGGLVAGVPVLGSVDLLQGLDAWALACVGSARDPESRLRLVERSGIATDRWATVVHPGAVLPPGCALGEGTLVLAGVVVTAPLSVGAHVVVMPGTVLTHDDEIAAGATFAAGVRLSGSVAVGRAAYLGTGALVREGVRIGAGAVVGMGAVLLTDVGPNEVWVGAPARLLRRRCPRTAALTAAGGAACGLRPPTVDEKG